MGSERPAGQVPSDEPTGSSETRHDARRPDDELPLDRFNAFTDGVFAIAITLLVLELSVPAEGEPLVPALVNSGRSSSAI